MLYFALSVKIGFEKSKEQELLIRYQLELSLYFAG